MTKEELKQKIIDNNRIYRSGYPVISDSEYDELVEEFKREYPDEYDSFRDTLNEGIIEKSSELRKINHKYVLGSLDKIKNDDIKTMNNYISKFISRNGKLNISAKVDGISSELVYRDGMLVEASSRGDGYVGVDYTDKIKYVKFIPEMIPHKSEMHIRGELVILVDDMPDSETNRRNVGAGIMNRKDWNVNDVRKMSFIPYTILGNEYTKDEQFKLLSEMGFKTAWNEDIEVSEVDDSFMSLLTEKAKIEHEYSCDGLVLMNPDDNNEIDEYRPKNSMAFKINELSGISKVIDVSWDGPSKNGRFIPVACIEPVEIGGAVITRASCHNLDVIESLGIRYGSIVSVTKNNDIIPQIQKVISNENTTEIERPTLCPCCGSTLVVDGPFLVCDNPNCSDKTTYQVEHFIKKLGVEFASFKTLDAFGIHTINDLISFRPDKSYKSEVKLYDSLSNKMFNRSRSDLFKAMNFDGLSEILLGKIIDFYGLDYLLGLVDDNGLNEEIYELPTTKGLPDGVGMIMFNKFVSGFGEAVYNLNMITKDPRYSYTENKANIQTNNVRNKNISVCFTGPLVNMGRNQASEFAKSYGWTVKSGVSKGLTYLVTNEKTMTTKMRKALELGITIIDEDKFISLVNSDLDSF